MPETERPALSESNQQLIRPREIEAAILRLGEIGRCRDTGVWRTVYTAEWRAAMDHFASMAGDRGLAVRRDAVGNVWARLDGDEGGPSIVAGSHLDTQTPGGRYDGALGALAAIFALGALKDRFGAPRRTLEAVALCEEEGSRFPTAGFWGSRAITGRIAPGDPETVVGYDGETIADAMREAGLDPAHCGEARRDDIEAFIELHIEQGPVLEHADAPVAIVDAITGIAHRRVRLTGAQNHAGAFPMDLRTDPMAGFAEIASRLVDHAHRLGRPAVTTIGRIAVDPNMPAVIPRSVEFTVDARHPDPAARDRMYAAHEALIREAADRRGLAVETEMLFDHPPCLSDPALIRALEEAAVDEGIRTIRMPSGAGHDAQQMARIARTAMIFVRSKDGRSHTPEEYSSPEDCAEGVRLLTAALHKLAY